MSYRTETRQRARQVIKNFGGSFEALVESMRNFGFDECDIDYQLDHSEAYIIGLGYEFGVLS